MPNARLGAGRRVKHGGLHVEGHRMDHVSFSGLVCRLTPSPATAQFGLCFCGICWLSLVFSWDGGSIGLLPAVPGEARLRRTPRPERGDAPPERGEAGSFARTSPEGVAHSRKVSGIQQKRQDQRAESSKLANSTGHLSRNWSEPSWKGAQVGH